MGGASRMVLLWLQSLSKRTIRGKQLRALTEFEEEDFLNFYRKMMASSSRSKNLEIKTKAEVFRDFEVEKYQNLLKQVKQIEELSITQLNELFNDSKKFQHSMLKKIFTKEMSGRQQNYLIKLCLKL